MTPPAVSRLTAGRCRLLRRLLVVLSCTALVSAGLAQSTGTIAGVVRNQGTGANLEGAVVDLQGTAFSTTTERDGSFEFSHVPAGQYRLHTFYTGLDVKDLPVEVRPGERTVVDVPLTASIYKLDTFTVAGEREGNAVSITKQRNAPNVVNVVSMDSYGDVADGNIGNFLQNIPGVAANKEAGDIVGVGLRGTPPEMNSVTLDGVRTASAIAGFTPQGDRAALIDQIPSEFIKEIEVTKGNTPDQPADSLGGSINLVTKSAFDFKNRVITYRAGVNHNTYRSNLDRWGPTGALTLMDTFGPARKLGVAVSASYTETTNTRDRVQMEHRSPTDFRNTRARTLDDINTRVRAGAGGKLEYRFDPTSRVWVTGEINYYASDMDRVNWQASAGGGRRVADYSRVSRAAIEAGATPRDSTGATAGVAPGFTDTYTELLNPTWINQSGHETKRSHQYKIGTGAEKELGDSKLTLNASWNPSSFDNNFHGFTTTTSGIGLAIDTSKDQTRPEYIQTYGPTIGYGSDFSRYTGQRFEQPDITREEISDFRGDFEKPFQLGSFPLQFKTGAEYRRQHRWYITYRPTWNYVGADGVAGLNKATGVNDDNLAQFVDSTPGYGLFNNRMPRRDKVDLVRADALFRSNPTYFAPSGTSVAFHAPPSIIAEGVSAAYAQADLKLGRLNILGGARVERTDIDAHGSYKDPLNPSQNTIELKKNYQKVFPSLHLKYTVSQNLLFRASYSTSSARPALSALVPNTTVGYDATTGLGTVTQGNPGLKPNYTRNYDLSAEYYFEPSGVLSAGAFRKDITDFVTSVRGFVPEGPNNGFGGEYGGFDLNTTTNIGKAKIEGVEFNYNQQFRFLPKPFNGLSLFANYTKLKTEGTYQNGAHALAGFVPETYNVGVSYDWARLQVRLIYHFKSAFLNNYSADPTAQVYVTNDPTVDINIAYRWRPQLSFFVDVINIYNNSPDWYAISPQHVDMSELYGTRLNIGVSGRF